MKKIWKDWTGFEKILLLVSVFLITASGIITKSEILTIIASLVGITCALMQAKGKVISQFMGVLEAILYSILSFQNQYYGEVIIYMVVVLPTYLFGIYSWVSNKNKDTDTVIAKIFTKREWIVLLILNVILFVVLYIILQYFNTNALMVSTLSMLASLTATYLIARRNKYSFLFFIINDVILLILWGIPVLQGEISLIPILIEPFLLLINDSYGWKNWNENEKNNGKEE